MYYRFAVDSQAIRNEIRERSLKTSVSATQNNRVTSLDHPSSPPTSIENQMFSRKSEPIERSRCSNDPKKNRARFFRTRRHMPFFSHCLTPSELGERLCSKPYMTLYAYCRGCTYILPRKVHRTSWSGSCVSFPTCPVHVFQ